MDQIKGEAKTRLPEEIINALRAIVGDKNLYLDAESLTAYGQDSSRMFEPAPSAVILPKTTEQVRQTVLLANEKNLALVPSGGRTGLSGAATARHGELILAMDRMNKILGLDPANQSIHCQAGVVTMQIQRTAEDADLYYPVDFASSGSSQIGGNVSTNAGGIKVIRYGMTRNWVLGLKVVTGSGDILELNKGLMKNNAAFDLRQLFIGAEGTLGIVTEVILQLTKLPKNLCVMMLAVPSFAEVIRLLHVFRSNTDIAAFEFLSEEALKKVIQRQNLTRPLDTEAPYYVLIEFESRHSDDLDAATSLLEHSIEQGQVLDGVLSQSERQAKNLWRFREDISDSLSRWSPYKNDLSVTVSNVPEFIEDIDKVVSTTYPEFEVIWYGHIGDGNLHLNILKPDDLELDEFKSACDSVSKQVFEVVKKYSGSVSAEHGIGLLKKPYLEYTRSREEIGYMRQIKRIFDPNGIMNPGKIFD